MDEHGRRRIQKRLTFTVTSSFALTPIIGYTIALFFGMVEPQQLLSETASLVLLASYAILLSWVAYHFARFLKPIFYWLEEHPQHHNLPDSLNLHLKSFTDNYWAFFLLYTLTIPTVQHWYGLFTPETTAVASLLSFILLQLVISILVGMPGYLYTLSTLGKLVEHIGFNRVNVSMKTKMLLVGGYIPLLTTTLFLQYYWWRTQYLTTEIVLIWAALGLTAFALTILAIRSLHQSLQPVQEVISGSGATDYPDMAKRLRPRSTDEVGYLIQMLGRLFHRLSEQESHMHAVVDNAAEGIIVINDQEEIETFNPAAETLFGYSCHEIRGKPLSWLIPHFSSGTLSAPQSSELEVEGRHNTGYAIPMSVRVSQMQSDGKTYYTCLVADISERKATEQKLIEAEERYRGLVETAHDLVWSMDRTGRWTYLNDAVTRIYGYEAAEMINMPYTEFQAPESVARDEAAFRSVLKGEELLQYETVHLDKLGNTRHISFNAKPQLDEKGRVTTIMGTARDITAQKTFEHELTYQAQHDSLTGLYNRNYFQQELERLVTRVARSGADCALLYMDLDQFKYVNDTLGHAAGDRLLIECSNMLKNHLREGDLLARFGGDEFTVLLYNVDKEGALRVAEHIRTLFENYCFMDSGKTFNVTSSIGVAYIDNNIETADEALSQADLACNISKAHGRNCLHLYDPYDKDKDGMAEDMGWASRVRDAFENDRFQLSYQPIVSVADGNISDYEVLLRMQLDDGNVILPGGFLPAAERFGLIHHVDRWTVRRAITDLAKLHDEANPLHFAINLSGRAFEDKELLPMINSMLLETQLPPSSLTFEITESAAISNLAEATTFINRLKEMGCQFALDDFGTGFCSFAYLKHLPVDKLKIDGSFVKGLAHASVDQAMVKSMNQIAHALGKQTIAEFVENKETLALLKDYGVDYAQGHFCGKPVKSVHTHARLSTTLVN